MTGFEPGSHGVGSDCYVKCATIIGPSRSCLTNSSLGTCNVFCCNCDGACRSNSTLDLDQIVERFKRNIGIFGNIAGLDSEALNVSSGLFLLRQIQCDQLLKFWQKYCYLPFTSMKICLICHRRFKILLFAWIASTVFPIRSISTSSLPIKKAVNTY